MNTCISLLLHIQPNCNIFMLAKDDNISDYFIHHKKEKYPLGNKEKNVENNQKEFVDKSSDIKSHTRAKRISQN